MASCCVTLRLKIKSVLRSVQIYIIDLIKLEPVLFGNLQKTQVTNEGSVHLSCDTCSKSRKFCQGPRHRLALTSWVCWISKLSIGYSDSQNRNQEKWDFQKQFRFKTISFQIHFVPFSTRLGSRRGTRCFDGYFQDPCAAPRKVHPREFPLFLGKSQKCDV